MRRGERESWLLMSWCLAKIEGMYVSGGNVASVIPIAMIKYPKCQDQSDQIVRESGPNIASAKRTKWRCKRRLLKPWMSVFTGANCGIISHEHCMPSMLAMYTTMPILI